MKNQQILSEKNTISSAIQASAIIVSWNTKELLRTCIQGLLTQEGVKLDIFVVDNNSSDGTVHMLRSEFPSIKCIANIVNAGFGSANNQALRIAQGDYLVLINPDIEFQDTITLKSFLTKQREQKTGISGPMLLNTDLSIQKSVRADPTFISQVLTLLKLHILFPFIPALKKYYLSDFNYQILQTVQQISGAFFSISRECFEKTGLFDERFYIWFEEVDYCIRARKKNFVISYIPDVSVIHHGGQSFQKIMPLQRQKVFNKSLGLFAKKYFTPMQRFFLRMLFPINRLLAYITPSFIKPSTYRLHK